MVVCRSFLRRMRNVSDQSLWENQKHILCAITYFRKCCRIWGNVEKYGGTKQITDDNMIRRMLFACWIIKAADTHLAYVMHIDFPRQQWLRECTSMLRYTNIACVIWRWLLHERKYLGGNPLPEDSILECDTHVANLRCSRSDYHMCNIFGFRNSHIRALKKYDKNWLKFVVHVRGLSSICQLSFFTSLRAFGLR
jgi:hypothetical protein